MDTDVFSDGFNAKLLKFCTLYYHPNSLAVDAFSADWSALGCLWLCPPVSLLIKTAKRIRSSKCEGVIVFPVWKTSTFYNFFFEEGVPKPPFQLIKLWHPYIFQNENARKTPLFGQVPFEFAAFYFNTKNGL
jgi:hypothetical protein